MHYQWDSCRDEEPFVIFFMPVRSVQRLPVHYTGGLSQRRCTLFALSFCWLGGRSGRPRKSTLYSLANVLIRLRAACPAAGSRTWSAAARPLQQTEVVSVKGHVPKPLNKKRPTEKCASTQNSLARHG